MSTFTITDIAALIAAGLLTVNAIARARGTTCRKSGLLRANIAMIVVLLFSITPIYAAIDPYLGGKSILNLFTHLLMVYTSWEVSHSTITTLNELIDKNRPWFIHPIVAGISCAGVLGNYLLLAPNSSRGLEAYDQSFVFVSYWACTLAPLVLGAIYLVPKLPRILPLVRDARLITKATVILLWLAFLGVLFSILGWTVTTIAPVLYCVREWVVTTTLFLFTISFFFATASLPQSVEGQSIRKKATKR